MKPPWFVFGTLLALCVILGIAFLTPQVPYEDVVREDGSTQRIIKSHGYQHDKFATMKQGGPGAERHAVTVWLGWVFASLSILLFASCLAMGMTRNGSLGPARAPLIGGMLVLAAIFTGLFISYYRFMHEDTHTLFLSLPKPTAWMLLGVWQFPIFFIVLYYRLFDRWFFTEDDERRFEEIVAAERGNAGEDF